MISLDEFFVIDPNGDVKRNALEDATVSDLVIRCNLKNHEIRVVKPTKGILDIQKKESLNIIMDFIKTPYPDENESGKLRGRAETEGQNYFIVVDATRAVIRLCQFTVSTIKSILDIYCDFISGFFHYQYLKIQFDGDGKLKIIEKKKYGENPSVDELITRPKIRKALLYDRYHARDDRTD